MTGARRPRPPRGPDRRGRRSRWQPSPSCVAAGVEVVHHPRQRPAGRQPAGQERARRGRRTARAAGLVRRADPGDPRLRADGRARRGAGRARDRPAAARPLVTRTLVDADDPGFAQPTKPIGRYLPARRGAAARRARRDLGGPRREGLAPRRRLARAARDPRRAAPCCALVEAGFVVVANGGGGIPVVRRGGRRRCAASRRSSTRTSAPRCSAPLVGADVLVIATDVPHAVLALRHARGRAARPRSTSREMRAYAAEGHFASGSMGPKVDAVCRFVEAGRRARPSSPACDRIADAVDAATRRHRRRTRLTDEPTAIEHRGRPCPSAIEVRKVPIHSVSDASRAGQADRRRRDRGRPGDRGHRQDRGQRRRQRLHPDHRRPRVPRGAGRARAAARRRRSSEVPIVWSGGTDGVISPHATIFATVPADDVEPTDEPRLTVGFAMSEVLLPEDIGRIAMVEKVADAVKVAMERAGHHRPGRRPLRADQDPAADHRHHPRREEPRARRVDRGHPRVDGPLQRRHGARHRGRARRDRDADRRRRACTTARCSRRWPRARPASSSTRRRSSWSATRAGSAAATGSATR